SLGGLDHVVELLGEFHGQAALGGASVELAIDEVRQATEKQADGSHGDEVVSMPGPGGSRAPGEEPGDDGDAQHASMAGHAPAEEVEEAQGIGDEAVEVVKQHVAEPPSQHGAYDGTEGDEVGHLRFLQLAGADS